MNSSTGENILFNKKEYDSWVIPEELEYVSDANREDTMITSVPASDEKLSLMEQFLSNYASSSASSFRYMLKAAERSIGKEWKDITSDDIILYYESLFTDRAATGKSISSSYSRMQYYLLTQYYSFLHPELPTTIPELSVLRWESKKESEIFTKDDVTLILHHVDSLPWKEEKKAAISFSIAMCFYCGLTASEVLSLVPSSVHADNKTGQYSCRVFTKGVKKSGDRIRLLTMPAEVVPYYIRLLPFQRDDALLGYSVRNKERYSIRNLQYYIGSIAKELDPVLGKHISLQALRTSCLFQYISSDMDSYLINDVAREFGVSAAMIALIAGSMRKSNPAKLLKEKENKKVTLLELKEAAAAVLDRIEDMEIKAACSTAFDAFCSSVAADIEISSYAISYLKERQQDLSIDTLKETICLFTILCEAFYQAKGISFAALCGDKVVYFGIAALKAYWYHILVWEELASSPFALISSLIFLHGFSVEELKSCEVRDVISGSQKKVLVSDYIDIIRPCIGNDEFMSIVSKEFAAGLKDTPTGPLLGSSYNTFCRKFRHYTKEQQLSLQSLSQLRIDSMRMHLLAGFSMIDTSRKLDQSLKSTTRCRNEMANKTSRIS